MTLKKHATGTGKATKDQMIQAAYERWGKKMTQDEADASWAADYAALTPQV